MKRSLVVCDKEPRHVRVNTREEGLNSAIEKKMAAEGNSAIEARGVQCVMTMML